MAAALGRSPARPHCNGSPNTCEAHSLRIRIDLTRKQLAKSNWQICPFGETPSNRYVAVPLLGRGRRRFGSFQAGQVLVDFLQFAIEHDQSIGSRLLAVVPECPLALSSSAKCMASSALRRRLAAQFCQGSHVPTHCGLAKNAAPLPVEGVTGGQLLPARHLLRERCALLL